MEDRTGKLIQAYNEEGEMLALFKFTGNNCTEDHLKTVLREYYAYDNDENANLHLFRWGLERVAVEYEVFIDPVSSEEEE